RRLKRIALRAVATPRRPWVRWRTSANLERLLVDDSMPLDWLTRLDPLRRIDCPVCLRRFALFQTHLRCDKACRAAQQFTTPDPILTRALQGPRAAGDPGSALMSVWWTDPAHDPERAWRRWLDWVVLPGGLTCPV